MLKRICICAKLNLLKIAREGRFMNSRFNFLLKASITSTLISLSTCIYAGGPTITFTPINSATAVPTLSSYMIIILSLLLLVVALRISKQKGVGKLFTFLLCGSILMASTGGSKLISDLQAGGYTSSISTTSGPTTFPIRNGDNRYTNSSGVAQEVTSLALPVFCPTPSGNPVCTSSSVLPDGSFCDLNCPFAPVVSDNRLKHSINPLVTLDSGIKIYSFKYQGKDDSVYVGTMAQELLKDARYSHAVKKMPNNYYRVDYRALGLQMITLDEWQKSPSSIFGD